MEYNKTKRNLEKAAGIVGVIASIIDIIFIFYYIIFTIEAYSDFSIPRNLPQIFYNSFWLFIVLSFVIIVLVNICLVVSVYVIKSPVKDDGTIEERTGLRVSMMIFSFLSGNLVSAGLMIAVLCLKDFKEEQSNAIANIPQGKNELNSVDVKVAELKHLKETGVIDDEAYNKAIDKIMNDYKKELKK